MAFRPRKPATEVTRYRFALCGTPIRGDWRATIEEAIEDGGRHAALPEEPPPKILWAPLMFHADGRDRYTIQQERVRIHPVD